jgi:hypothetical protein
VPKVSPMQTSFGGGEFSPLLNGQVDLDRYKQALERSLNYLPALQGGLIRRSGTYYVANSKSNGAARLIRFEFSTTQAYILEFGDQYIRFYRNNGQIQSLGSAYEIATPYLAADLFQLRFTQSADVLFITHPSYAPRTLSRTGHTSWTLATIDFLDGPYLPNNITAFSLTPGAATGTGVTLKSGATTAITAAANNGSGLIRITSVAHGKVTGDMVGIEGVVGTTEANGSWTITKIDADNFDLQSSTFTNAWVSGGTVHPKVFASTDVGRFIRLKEGSTWGWAKIASFVHYGSVTIDIQSTLTNTGAKTNYRLGVWSATTGYPAVVTFHEDRLGFAAATNYPQRLDLSCTNDYYNFRPSDTAGVVLATDALSFTFNANDVNTVRWIISDEKGLLVGTAGGEWLVRPSSQGEALTPTNITAKRSTKYGSANVQAIQVGKSALFLQRAGRKVRELNYYFDADGFRAVDLTLLAEHITESGIVEMAPLAEPQPILWCVREDGILAALTYERDVDTFKVGWHRHKIGGSSDSAGSHAEVESVASIPSADGTRDELWLLVKRRVNGSTVRHIEYLKPLFDDTMDQEEAYFVDCGLTYDDPKTISSVSIADPGVFTSTSHGFSNGDKVLVKNIIGLIDEDDAEEDDPEFLDEDGNPTSPLNGESFYIAAQTTHTFRLTDLDGATVSTADYSAYVSGGQVRKFVSTISGMTHLPGETIDILADGAVQPSKVVSAGGTVSLSDPACTVHMGYAYKSQGKMLRLNAGAADGTAIGKTQRSHRMGIMLHRSLGLKIGVNFEEMTRLTFRKTSDKKSRPVPLFTGILSEELEADYDFENQFCWEQDQPLPSMLLALMPQMVTQDR